MQLQMLIRTALCRKIDNFILRAEKTEQQPNQHEEFLDVPNKKEGIIGTTSKWTTQKERGKPLTRCTLPNSFLYSFFPTYSSVDDTMGNHTLSIIIDNIRGGEDKDRALVILHKI